MNFHLSPRNLAVFILLFLSIWPVGSTLAADWQSQSMTRPRDGAMPLLPYIDYYIDQGGTMDIEEVAAPAMKQEFKPLVMDELPHKEGITWLRFTIASLPHDTKPGVFLLDMSQSVPGVPELFNPQRNELSDALEWQGVTPAMRNIFLLPEETSQPITCYIRVDGVPGPWFAPMIRTPQNAASNLLTLARPAAILALGLVMLICLLRGLSESGQWRIWTALFVAVAFAQAFLGMPAISSKFSAHNLAAVLSPGIALMLLPHVGRHLMQTRANSKSLDIQLFLLSLPGAAIALWPLVPGWSWLERWLDLWPLATILFVPTSLGAWIMGLGGSRRFLVGCLIPPIFTAFALFGLEFGFPANLLASLPVWAVALCAMLIAVTKSPDKEPQEKKAPKSVAIPEAAREETIIPLEHPLDDPNLRLLPVTDTAALASIPVEKSKKEQLPPTHLDPVDEREAALREPLDEILRQGAALGQCSLSPAVRQYAEDIISAANSMAGIISGEGQLDTSGNTARNPVATVFSLQRVLRNAHDAVAPFAESSGTALSWYVPPHIDGMYRGEAHELEKTLRLLLESAVRASRNGSVNLSARKVQGSSDPGHLLFSITDNGTGYPPRDRSSLAIARAWELIGRHGGYLAMEAGPEGVSMALSMRFGLAEENEARDQAAAHVILASDNSVKRRELAHILEELDCYVSQAASSQEVIAAQTINPTSLLIVHGQLARPAAADMTHKFADLANRAGFTQVFILAITLDDSQWNLLKPSGFTHAMLEPENPESLKKTVEALLTSLNLKKESAPEDEPQDQVNDADLPSDGTNMPQDIADSHEGVDEANLASHFSADMTPPLQEQMAATMIVEQNFPINSSFEGPDWLDEKTTRLPDASDRQTEEQQNQPMTAETLSTPAQTHVTGQPAARPGVDKPGVPADKADENAKAAMLEPDNVATQTDENEFKLVSDSEKEVTEERKETKQPEFAVENPTTANGLASDPVVFALIKELDMAMQTASRAFEANDAGAVADATEKIVRESEKVGLRVLAKMASCVERAARAQDLNAISDLLPELALAVERNRLVLMQARQQ